MASNVKINIDDYIKYVDVAKTDLEFGAIKNCKSKIYIKCSCSGSWSSTIERLRDSIRRYGTARCKSCRTKELWKDEDYRQNISTMSSQLWENQDYRNNINDAFRRSLDSGQRASISQRSIRLWENDEYRKKRSDQSRQLWKTEEYRKKFDLIWNSDSFKQKMSEISKSIWGNIDFRKQQAIAQAEFRKNGADSSLERVAQSILTELGFDYERHRVIGPYEFDIYVESLSLLIECQGEYWHSFPKNKGRDSSKLTYVHDYYPEYRLLYLDERDFLNPQIVKHKIQSSISGQSPCVEVQDFDFDQLTIQSIDTRIKEPNSRFSKIEEFFCSYHYARYGRNSAKIVYGVFLGDFLIAGCKFSSPMRRETATSMGFKFSEVLELDRFCIHPSYQKKNLASWFISRCLNLVFDTFSHINAIVSFADSTFGHHGTIYKASNWSLVGIVPPSYHYVDKNGFPIHKKTLWDHSKSMKMSEVDYAVHFDYTKIHGRQKTKYAYYR
jgi:hypothetical protein